MEHGSFEEMIEANDLAHSTHADQLDKPGHPYINHVDRVVRRLVGEGEKTVGWLHDVVEDSEVTLDDLRRWGFSSETVDAVEAITHLVREQRARYYARVKKNPLALKVKLADIADNTDPRRLLELPAETMVRLMRKYADALTHLGA